MNGTRGTRSSLGSHDRKLRYRALLEDLSTLEDEASNNVEKRMERTSKAVLAAEALLAEGNNEERVKHPGEVYLDSRVLRATSDLTLQCSEALSSNANTYDKDQLAAHIRENPDFWEFLFPREAPPVAYTFGAFEPTPLEQRPRAPRRRVERQQEAALKAPETVDKLQKVEEGGEMVSRVHRFLTKEYHSRRQPLSYFHVVLDPGSFSRTVENVYNVSFLVRDALLRVDLDEDSELPFITPVPQKEVEARAAAGGNLAEENQFIVSLDMKRWRDLIAAFDIRKPLMVIKRKNAETA